VTFADGTRAAEWWDGRAASKELVFQSPAQAVSVEVDPGRVIALDYRRSNNSMTRESRRRVPAGLWAARWFMWLEHALLTSALFV
jgi:hypothetical protein